ncbi:MAG: OmpA family protein [Muribaculaceae bacterium]|nr:OmpA family protein [Muribaculaceae bacterium]
MKTRALFTTAVCCALLVPALEAKAQDETVVVEETAVLSEVPCDTHYYVTKHDNWFIQFGAGVAVPFVEGRNAQGDRESHFTVNYNVGFGKWFSPYLGWRLAFNGGPLHYERDGMNKFKYVGANLDFMWDMFNSLGGVNSKRVFSIIPFVGLGGTYAWDFNPTGNIASRHGGTKDNSWTLPVSGGLQMRFRLCKYVDFFAEARASFYGDNWNNIAEGRPVDINVTVNGGFAITFGGRDYRSYNPCDYLGYINNLNDQVNDLRGALTTTAAALAAAEAQLPCPEVVEAEATVIEAAPLMATVRFTLNSSKISDIEMVNVFNIAQWMKENPEQTVAIAGYADKDTGTSTYNMELSKRRAEAVRDALVNKYGINPDRLSLSAEGSDVQPYDVNNWNRIVIFNVAQ